MKKLLLLFVLTPFFTRAQDRSPLVEGVSPGLFITHKVAPKENYYSIGRIYNISPKDIAPFNNLKLESGLSLGQVIKIPLNNSNFFQQGTAAPDETFVPVYYAIKDKEGLYRVAVNHNDLPVETLKQWNNIKGDAVKSGTKLIIGYLKVKKELSGLAKNGVGASIGSNAVITAKPEEKKTLPAEPAPIPVEKKEVIQPVVKETPKEPVKPVVEKPVVETKRANPVASSNGTFKDQYGSQTKNSQSVEESGTAGVFKSSSGWTDKKYYCLYNSASQGTIIKISNPANGKFVFAKVLDMMPDIKQNEGLLITISNAAADELGASGNFNCTISYSK